MKKKYTHVHAVEKKIIIRNWHVKVIIGKLSHRMLFNSINALKRDDEIWLARSKTSTKTGVSDGGGGGGENDDSEWVIYRDQRQTDPFLVGWLTFNSMVFTLSLSFLEYFINYRHTETL